MKKLFPKTIVIKLNWTVQNNHAETDPFYHLSHISCSTYPFRLILEPLETRFKGLQLFRRGRDLKTYQRPSKVTCKTLFVMKLKTKNSILMCKALFSFLYHAYRLKTTYNPWLTWLSMHKRRNGMLKKLKDSKDYL